MRFEREHWARALRGDSGQAQWLAAAETCLLTAVFIGLSVGLRSSDPLFLSAPFPWCWLVPLSLALRYGSNAAILSSALLTAAWFAGRAWHWHVPDQFPTSFFLGGFISSLIAGEFRDVWKSRSRKEQKTLEHVQARLNSLAGAHSVLTQSHERLLTDFLTHPPTLRDALAALPRPAGGRLDVDSAQALLILLARFFHLQEGAIHRVTGKKIDPAPLAHLGHSRPLDPEDPLIAGCLEAGTLCHALEDSVALNGLASEPPERPEGPAAPRASARGTYLLAAPLSTGSFLLSHGDAPSEPVAILVVEKMPFFAFQSENLRALNSVLGYYIDHMDEPALAAPIVNRLPDCPEAFAAEYLRLQRLRAEADVESALVAVEIPAAGHTASEWLSKAKAVGRGADLFWISKLPSGDYLLRGLLPFAGAAAARAFLTRIGTPVQATDSNAKVRVLGGSDPVEFLADFVEGRSVEPAGKENGPAEKKLMPIQAGKP